MSTDELINQMTEYLREGDFYNAEGGIDGMYMGAAIEDVCWWLTTCFTLERRPPEPGNW